MTGRIFKPYRVVRWRGHRLSGGGHSHSKTHILIGNEETLCGIDPTKASLSDLVVSINSNPEPGEPICRVCKRVYCLAREEKERIVNAEKAAIAARRHETAANRRRRGKSPVPLRWKRESV